MNRSSRLLATGGAVLTAGLVATVVALSGANAAPAAPAAVQPAPATTATAPLAVVEEDAPRLPSPLVVPDGHEALTVTAVFDRAVADLPGPGDRVNVYGLLADTRSSGAEIGQQAPGAVRAVSDVEVLGVASNNVDGATGNVTLVLAVTPQEAATVVYLAGVEQVWFSLLPDEGEAASTGDVVTREALLDAVG